MSRVYDKPHGIGTGDVDFNGYDLLGVKAVRSALSPGTVLVRETSIALASNPTGYFRQYRCNVSGITQTAYPTTAPEINAANNILKADADYGAGSTDGGVYLAEMSVQGVRTDEHSGNTPHMYVRQATALIARNKDGGLPGWLLISGTDISAPGHPITSAGTDAGIGARIFTLVSIPMVQAKVASGQTWRFLAMLRITGVDRL